MKKPKRPERKTLNRAVRQILEACLESCRPERYHLVAALKEDRGSSTKNPWPDSIICKALGSGFEEDGKCLKQETIRIWSKTNRILLDAIMRGTW